MTSSINIRFNGESNLGLIHKDIAKLRSEFALLQKDAISASQIGDGNTRGYRNMSDGMKAVRENFRIATAAAGEFQIVQQKLVPQSTAFGEAIKQQKVGMMDLIRQRRLMSTVLKEQIALQNASSLSWSVDRTGKISSDLIIPKNLPADLITTRQRLGLFNSALASVSQNTINWGKNTQWAGRQLMTGLTLPLGLLAAAAGKFAYDYNKALTNVVKVYGDANAVLQESSDNIKTSAMSTVRAASAIYGQSGKDTLEIMAALAAAGKQGNELQQATMMTSRASILGELEWQDAVKATITLQSVYSHSAQQIGDDFNYINAMENQTVLSSKDFVIAIPKVSGVMNALGADLKDVGTLLTAFKASGIDAAEGANALKSINFRLVGTYGKGLDTFYKATGQSLKAIIAETNGETIPSLMRFGAALEGLSAPQKIAVVRDVFGIYQGSKALLMLEQLTEGSDQLARALAVGDNSVAQNAAIAQQELDRLNAEPFTIIKKAAQSLQITLQDIGAKILPIVGEVFTKIANAAKAFSNWPTAYKGIVLVGAGLIAIAGPVIMLVGLFANLIGNVGRMSTALIQLGTRFTITDAAERAQILQGKLAAQTWDLQTAAIQKQTIAMETLAGVMVEKNALIGPTVKAQPMMDYSNMYQDPQSQRWYKYQGDVNGPAKQIKGVDVEGYKRQAAGLGAVNRAEYARVGILQEQAILMNEQMRITDRRIRTATSGLMAAGMIGTMVTDSNTVAGNVANIALMGGMLLSMFQGVAKKIWQIFMGMFAVIGEGFARVFGVQLVGVLGRAKVALMAFAAANKAAMAGALVIVAALYMAWDKVRDNTEKSRQAVQDYNDFTKTVADQLGFSYQETPVGIPGPNTTLKVQAADASKKWSAENEAAAAAFSAKKGLTTGEKWGEAVALGASVKIHGGTVDAAAKATRMALVLMGEQFNDAEFETHLKLLVDFNDPKSISDSINARIKAALEQTSKMETSVWDRVFNWDTNKITEAGTEVLSKAYKEAIDNALAQPYENQAAIFDNMFKTVGAPVQQAFNKAMKTDPAYMKKVGMDTIESFTAGMKDKDILGLGEILSKVGFTEEEVTRVKMSNEQIATFVTQLREIQGITIPDNLTSLEQIRTYIGTLVGARTQLMSITNATKQYESAQKTWIASTGKPMNEEQQLAALNSARVSAGLERTLYVLDKFGPASTDFVQAVKTMDTELTRLQRFEGVSAAITSDIVTSSWKSVISGTIGDVAGVASASLEAESSAGIDAVKAKGDAALKGIEANSKAVDNAAAKATDKQKERDDKAKKDLNAAQKARKKAIEDGFAAQLKGVERAIEAEKAQEDLRQKLFEAEKTRIQRLAEMFNKNVDLNMAINSGNLDEAAKIQNDITSTQQGWTVGDAAAGSKTESEKKIAALDKKKDNINALKDARLAALDIEQAAEDEALTKTIKREDDALKKKQDNDKAAVQSAKDAQTETNRIEVEKATKTAAIQKASFEQQLAEIRAYIPRNVAEMNTQIAEIDALYKKYGVEVLTPEGQKWGAIVAKSLSRNVALEAGNLKTIVAWSTVGNDIASGMIQGAFGMNPAAFAKWLAGGVAPPDSLFGTTPKGKMLDYAEAHPDRLGKASGGAVWGRGTGTSDSIKAWLSNGEFVINARQTAKHRPILEAINSGLPAFAGGGAVDSMGMAGLGASFIGGITRVLMEKTIGALAARGPLSSGKLNIDKRTIGEGAAPSIIGGETITGASRDRLRQFGHILQALGFNVGENVAFGKVYPVHAPNSWHYRDGAIDVNYDGHGQGFENDKINSVLSMARQAGLRTIWQYPGHYNHAHFDIGAGADLGNFAGARHANGGYIMPQLKTGGFTLNDGYARLHKAETVLTAPLSKQLNDGIDKLANGPVTSYTIKADFNGATFASDVDVERAFQNLMDKAERRNGSNRKIGSK